MLFSCWYTRKELGVRTTYLYTGSLISGAFSGLISAGITKNMDGTLGLLAWRWLFIIEGIASVGVAVFTYWALPNNFEDAKFLNEDDKALMRIRAELNARYNGKPDFNWHDVKLAIKDPK